MPGAMLTEWAEWAEWKEWTCKSPWRLTFAERSQKSPAPAGLFFSSCVRQGPSALPVPLTVGYDRHAEGGDGRAPVGRAGAANPGLSLKSAPRPRASSTRRRVEALSDSTT